MVDLTNLTSKEKSAPSFTGGAATIVDKSAEIATKGLGNLFLQGVGAVDSFNRAKIREDITKTYDDVNNIFGVDDAAAISDNIPGQITKDSKYLRSLSAAHKQGKIRDSNYFGMLHARVRKLRTDYPGYRQEIDSIVSQVTGSRPANSLRRALLNEFDAEARKQEGEKNDWEKFKQGAIEDGSASPEVVAALQGDREQLTKIVLENRYRKARVKNTKAEIDLESASIGLEGKRDKRIEAKREELANTETSMIINDAISGAVVQGTGAPSAQGLLKLIEEAHSDGNIATEERTGIEEGFNQLKRNTDLAISQMFTQATYAKMSPERKKSIRESAMSHLDTLEEAIYGNQQGIATWAKRTLEAQANGDELSMLNSSAALRTRKALKSIGGDVLLDEYITAGGFKGNEVVLAGNAFIKTITGAPVSPTLEEMQRSNASPAVIKGHLETSFRVLREGTPEQKASVAKSLFDETSVGVLSTVSKADRAGMFKLFTSPSTTKAMMEMKDTQPEIWDRYQEISHNQFNVMFKEVAGDLSDAQEYFPNISVSFNEETLNFEVSDTSQEPGAVGNVSLNLSTNKQAKALYDKVNGYINNIKPILNETEDDPKASMASLLASASLDSNFVNRPSTFTDFIKAYVSPAANFVKDGGNRRIKDERSVLEGGLNEAATVIDSVEGGGEYTTLFKFSNREGETFSGVDITEMTLGELKKFSSSSGEYGKYSKRVVGKLATPMGRYQIVGTTLRGLQKNMNLPDDTVFTPEVQDAMFIELLKGRGLDDYKQNRISRTKFARNLAAEWEGLEKNRKALNDVMRAIDNIG